MGGGGGGCEGGGTGDKGRRGEWDDVEELDASNTAFSGVSVVSCTDEQSCDSSAIVEHCCACSISLSSSYCCSTVSGVSIMFLPPGLILTSE